MDPRGRRGQRPAPPQRSPAGCAPKTLSRRCPKIDDRGRARARSAPGRRAGAISRPTYNCVSTGFLQTVGPPPLDHQTELVLGPGSPRHMTTRRALSPTSAPRPGKLRASRSDLERRLAHAHRVSDHAGARRRGQPRHAAPSTSSSAAPEAARARAEIDPRLVDPVLVADPSCTPRAPPIGSRRKRIRKQIAAYAWRVVSVSVVSYPLQPVRTRVLVVSRRSLP
jgi:hypothetical protein